ncbi:MAG TPA: tetratricopeptide repeat protein, partial [Pyrinomonadaceae bacterium]
MRLSSAIVFSLTFLFVFQTPQETIRQHYEAAEAQRRAGNLSAAELEYTAILAEGYQRLAQIYSVEEDYQREIPLLESAAGYQPNSTSILLALAIARFNEKQYDAAIDSARKALLIDPQSADAHQMLGKSYFMLGDVTKAISELESAVKLAPDDIEVTYTLGIAYLRNRQKDAAKQLYQSMVSQFGDRPQLHIVIGRAYRQSGLLPEAAEEFKKAIALDPHFPRSHYYLGITYLLDEGQTKLTEASNEFNLELAANPDEFFANYYLGVIYIFQRKWDLAIRVLQKASAIEPNNPDPYFQISQAYQELNQHEQAIEVLKKSIALNPELSHNKGQVTAAHHRLAQSLLKLGQTEAGQKELEIASELKAQVFKLEQSQAATPALLASVSSAQETNTSLLGLKQRISGESNRQDQNKLSELKSGAAYYQKILATAHNNVGLLRAERQDYTGAIQQFALAVKWNPTQQGLDYNLGLAYYKSGLFERAIPALEKELQAHQENLLARVLLGMSYFLAEKYIRASQLLEPIGASTAADTNTYYALASSLIAQNKIQPAEEIFARMKATTGEGPYLHLLMAQLRLSKGDRAGALKELTEATKVDQIVPGVHFHAGLLYLKLASKDQAIRQFDEELTQHPNDITT